MFAAPFVEPHGREVTTDHLNGKPKARMRRKQQIAGIGP